MKTLLKSALIISAITAGVASTTAQADHGRCSKQIAKCAAKQAVRKAKCDVKKAKCALKNRRLCFSSGERWNPVLGSCQHP